MLRLYFLALFLLIGASPTVAAEQEQTVIVIVHGAWGGGGAFRQTE